MRAADARIAAVSSAALYGRGVFTTVAVFDGKLFLWEKHEARLTSDATKLNISQKDFGEVAGSLDELIRANSVVYGRARVTLFDEATGGAWRTGKDRAPSILIVTGDLRNYPDDLRLALSPFRVNSASPLAGIKSCNYLEKLIAIDEASGRGFQEAIMLNERDEVTSACMANLFWIKDRRLQTPSLETGCLAGTTRAFIIENIECEEVVAELSDLEAADAIFITSAGVGIRRVGSLDGRLFGAGTIAIEGFPHYP